MDALLLLWRRLFGAFTPPAAPLYALAREIHLTLTRIETMTSKIDEKIELLTAEVGNLRSALASAAERDLIQATAMESLRAQVTELQGAVKDVPADTTEAEAKIEGILADLRSVREAVDALDRPTAPPASIPAPAEPAPANPAPANGGPVETDAEPDA